MTINFPSFLIPLIITIISFGYSIFIYDDGPGDYFNGLGNLLMLIPSSIISAVAWIIWAILK